MGCSEADAMLLYMLALFATALLLGAMLFFSFVVLPVAHRNLEPMAARRFVRAVFPAYYRVLAALGTVAALALVAVDDRSEEHTPELQSRMGISFDDLCLKK